VPDQITGWGVMYYTFPVALAGIATDTGWAETTVTVAFSTGLIVSAVAGIPVGRLLDRYGPRPVMTGGSVVAVPALVLVALARVPTGPDLLADNGALDERGRPMHCR
jgi:MFS family permease